MRIYKGDVGFELTVQSFLDLLEEDALDEIINCVLDLEAEAALHSDFDGDIVYLGEVDLDNLDGDLSGLFDHITNNIDHFDVIEEDDYDTIFGKESALGAMFLDDADILDNFLLSNEDLRIKRIVKRFRHIDDAS